MPEPKRCNDLNELDPAFCDKLVLALDDAVQRGMNPLVLETYRSQERQDWLYAQGRKEPYLDRPKVTWTRNSKHTTRMAADVAPREEIEDGSWRINWNRIDLFDRWGEVAKAHGLVWGGDFKNYDGPHVQDERA